MGMQAPGRFELAVGFGPGRVVFASVMGLVLVPLSMLLGYLVGYLFSDFRSPGAGYATGAVLGGLALVYAVLAIVFAAQRAAWLDGPVLTVRGLRTRSVDLRGARSVVVAAKGQSASRRNPAIVIVGPDGRIRLPLRGTGGSLIGPAELHRLADALSTSRCPGAGETTAWLRALAADPHTPLR